ncbi:4-(cytidine 5'-diphospho)-2-C-methyl-D-erythritol kinase [Lachnospiraceae bacterium MD1]|uniref:4-diphosphocytidyl-2-C-methyl-D-erythritol kinase n=1 Tax=Variimorphobacter saccharofermentans TaxID=2755051 RepID=A0A839JV33_9FIRM|nr:4-(cytidine 5'-diphospho)-2-C-methyl-D-erythritol kinase [Variimorphobacter saccharofermentans]MBB2181350.1 4-(cytidine 5'-diphospho)-2-C-methyl-D-erythritol kinase [Variimorphobacter saccharofermentans]
MNYIRKNAYAKINLGLDVIRKREDGYHDVCMIMQSIDLYDKITISRSSKPGIRLHNNLSYLPTGQGNLVYKAASLFLSENNITEGLSIELNKHIPVAAGLAGGSSDAAVTLLGLNELFETGLSKEALMKLGVKLGADIPYCIMLGTVLSEGIGEVLTPLSPLPDCHILLVKPDINVSTKYVYENLKLDGSVSHPDINAMIASLDRADLSSLTKRMDNILQTVTIKEYPIIAEIKHKMNETGALASLMSGSGPTVFGIYSDIKVAESAFRFFKKNRTYGKQVFLTKPYWP